MRLRVIQRLIRSKLIDTRAILNRKQLEVGKLLRLRKTGLVLKKLSSNARRKRTAWGERRGHKGITCNDDIDQNCNLYSACTRYNVSFRNDIEMKYENAT